MLSKVTTTDTDTSKLQLLYSSLYFMQLLPQNKTGENPLWASSEPYYDDTFTLWDLVSSTAAAPRAFKLTILKVSLYNAAAAHITTRSIRGVYPLLN